MLSSVKSQNCFYIWYLIQSENQPSLQACARID